MEKTYFIDTLRMDNVEVSKRRYKEFMAKYLIHLAEIYTLEEEKEKLEVELEELEEIIDENLNFILEEALVNHRVQKFLVPYIISDKDTFIKYHNILVSKGEFYTKLIKHAEYILLERFKEELNSNLSISIIRTLLVDTKELIETVDELDEKLVIEFWEIKGYCDQISGYLAYEARNQELEKRREIT